FLADVNEIVLLFGGAGAAILITMGPRLWKVTSMSLLALPLVGLPSISLPVGASTFSLSTLFLTFLKIGSVLYGSGYVLLAFLRSDFVDRLHWLTDQQLLDAIAIGQVTPGPVSSTATFVGYVIDRVPGALLATVAIFLPSFIFVALLSRVLPHVRRSPWAGAALDGVNAASLGLMAGVLWQLGGDAIVDWYTWLLLAIALVAVFATKVNSAWIVVAGALAGLAYKGIA
ncbi:MAG: chromate transporter, partial [Chloroflexi bacterium]|nr:chromate transporter [Chloroflexota bacterium]